MRIFSTADVLAPNALNCKPTPEVPAGLLAHKRDLNTLVDHFHNNFINILRLSPGCSAQVKVGIRLIIHV